VSITVGCCGFPVSRQRYFSSLKAVEISSTFFHLPRLATAEKWRAEAPADFTYALKAWQPLTHLSSSPTYKRLRPAMDKRELGLVGHFRQNDTVWKAWSAFEKIVNAVAPRFIVFETPGTFYPNADHLRDIYKFFKRVRRGDAQFVWEPRGPSWEPRIIERTCKDLGLIHAVDPLQNPPQTRGVKYYRMHGAFDGRRIDYSHAYLENELKRAVEDCGAKSAFVFFNNHSMWNDSERFLRLADPVTAALRRAASRRPRRRL
jgi:uncharacterized protein YecE (DUF72 family)